MTKWTSILLPLMLLSGACQSAVVEDGGRSASSDAGADDATIRNDGKDAEVDALRERGDGEENNTSSYVEQCERKGDCTQSFREICWQGQCHGHKPCQSGADCFTDHVCVINASEYCDGCTSGQCMFTRACPPEGECEEGEMIRTGSGVQDAGPDYGYDMMSYPDSESG